MEETIEEAAASYAKAAHGEMHAHGADYVSEHFGTVEVFVAFEMNGDASEEVDRLAERFGIPPEEALAVLEAALGAVDLGFLNAVWRDEWVETEFVAMGERDAETYVEDHYHDADFDPEDAVDWAKENCDEALRKALSDAGFDDTLTHEHRELYSDALSSRVTDLVSEWDTSEVEQFLETVMPDAVAALYAAVVEAVEQAEEEQVLGAMQRLASARAFDDLVWEALEAAWERR